MRSSSSATMELLRRWWPEGGGSGVSHRLLLVLLVYSFSSQFLPIEPYLVPYFTSVKHFSNSQITLDVYPISVYSQLAFTLLMPPACLYLSHKVVIMLGAFGMLLTYVIIWAGQSLLSMKMMQVTYGFGTATKLAFSSYIFLLAPEEDYQKLTSLTTTTSLLAFVLASELSQYLALEQIGYATFFVLTLVPLVICCAVTFLFPTDRHSGLFYSSLASHHDQSEEWIKILKRTWHGKEIKILSLWWAAAYAGLNLMQNYGINLFDAVDSQSNWNGHVLAASQAAGSLGSFCAIYIEKFATNSGLFIYVLGSAIMSLFCVLMGTTANIVLAYLSYILSSGLYWCLACLVYARCGQLIADRRFILMFSLNNFAGLLLQTILQAVLEITRLSIFAQYVSFAGFFLLASAILMGQCCITEGKDVLQYSEEEPAPLVTDGFQMEAER